MIGLIALMTVSTGFGNTDVKIREQFAKKYENEIGCLEAQLRWHYQQGRFTSKHTALLKEDDCPSKFYDIMHVGLRGHCYTFHETLDGKNNGCYQWREEPCSSDWEGNEYILPAAEQLELCRYRGLPNTLTIGQIFDRLLEIAKEYNEFLIQANAKPDTE